jgi:hypothetical protein
VTDIIRLELSGKRADAWNRVFDTLTAIVEKAVDQIVPDSEPAVRDTAKAMSADVAEITKGFLQAKLERPVLENELTVAEIAIKFEELKTAKANREQIEVNTERSKVALERDRLALWEQRMVLAFKWLGFLQHHLVRTEDGNAVLLLTQQDMSSLLSDCKAIQQENLSAET